jgi:hypothetical protein
MCILFQELHISFIIAGANLRAFVYGLRGFPLIATALFVVVNCFIGDTNVERVKAVVSQVVVPPFVPQSG